MASELLKGENPEGNTVKIDFDGEELTFERSTDPPGKSRDKVVSAQVV